MIPRVFVVDDHEPWRRQLRPLLEKSGVWQVSAEAADGAEAVQKARSLQADLILLDVDLPRLSGIEAARRILANDPHSKILFLSAHSSGDIVEAALCTGAYGYVLKSTADYELLAAMDAVVNGRHFVSAMLTGRTLDRTSAGRAAMAPCRHEAGFYSEQGFLAEDFVRFAEAARDDRKILGIVLTASHRDEVHRQLLARGWDVERAVTERRLVWLDVPTTLAGFMVEGWPDATRFWKAATSLVFEMGRASREAQPRIALCGECAGTLLAAGHAAAAIRLEQLWDEFANTFNVEIFCGYTKTVHDERDDSDVFDQLCQVHTAVCTR